MAEIRVVGSTVFDQADLADLLDPYRDRNISFNDLLQLRSLITERYVDAGYLTSGALIPDRKSTRLNSSHTVISYAVFCLKKKKNNKKKKKKKHNST